MHSIFLNAQYFNNTIHCEGWAHKYKSNYNNSFSNHYIRINPQVTTALLCTVYRKHRENYALNINKQ